MRFCFGNISEYEKHVVVEAKNLQHAIKIFKVSELFPEKCVDSIYYKKDSEGYHDGEYDSILGRNIIKFKIDNPKIFIYEEIEKYEWKKIGNIGLQECINVNFRDILPSANLLEAPSTFQDNVEENKNILPVVVDANTLSRISHKIALRDKHDEIARKKAELEAMISNLNKAMSVLKNELKQKQKVIYILETFLGIHEEVVQIAEGDTAPEGSKLTLFQQKLYMDEEVGIWDDSDGQGIDFQQIEEFDEWIKKHYKIFAYEPLSIVVWQVRRNEKQYGNLWDNVKFNQWNKTTYFLIRNGSCLYRIWSNVTVDDLLFPTKNEYMNLIAEEKKWGEERIKEKLQAKHEGYLYGLIAIQGIIERTEILGTRLREQGVNLLKPRSDIDDHIRFIRDAETEHWIGDGKPRWSEFLKNNKTTIKLGSRICLATEKFHFSLSGKENDNWRCSPFHPNYAPQRNNWYLVEAHKNESKNTYFPHGTTILIRYHPGDTVWVRNYWNRNPWKECDRKRRVPWFLYASEVINFDEITIEEADYYMKSRLDRKNYVQMLPTLHWIREIKLKEKKLEEEFIKMIASQLQWDLNDINTHKIQDAITWWKLKNKWKRAITIKESTATRMILKKLKKDNII